LTDSLYFDTDCVSSFLWVKEEKILALLYSGKIVIPQQVYNELSFPGIFHLRKYLDALIDSKDAAIQPIVIDTPDFTLYHKLTASPDKGHSIIGKGEAAAIALATASHATIASNNMKDVVMYVSELGLRHITTGDILIEALKASLISESEGNTIWRAMLSKKRKLGFASFTDYLHMHINR
jgi:predicted nucleic acid-binding protein